MKSLFHIVLSASLLLVAGPVLAQKNVYLSDKVIKTADQINLNYKATVKKAVAKDQESLQKLFEFSRLVEGIEIQEHAVTCLEIIPHAGDLITAKAIAKLNTKLKKALFARLTDAQSRTKQEKLKAPLESWAPYTWKALNGQPIVVPDPNADPNARKAQDVPDAQIQAPSDKPAPTPAQPEKINVGPSSGGQSDDRKRGN